MNVLYEAIASLHRQVDERIADDATTPCLLSFDRARAVLDALLAYTAQPEQEPVAWVTGWHDGHCVIRAADPALMLPIGAALYTAPQRREWVGLTDEEVKALPQWFPSHETAAVLPLIRAIEAKLKEKNNG